MDGNTHALNKHLDAQDKQDLALTAFEKEVEADILIIDEMIGSLKNIAKDYKGYDFNEELNEMIKEIL